MSALSLLLAVLVATIVAPAAAPAAATRWTRPQDVLPQRCCAHPVSVASNARGDASHGCQPQLDAEDIESDALRVARWSPPTPANARCQQVLHSDS